VTDQECIGKIANRFVDEAGDGVLFNRRGQVIIGSGGCSRFFILGCASIADPDSVARDLAELRASLLADPYFREVPSMQPQNRKTALFFHAKDDLPEVRREVFALLRKQQGRIGFSAVVRDKAAVLRDVRSMQQATPEYRYSPNDLYDELVKSLFRNQLNHREAYNMYFAKRGSSVRTAALESALVRARDEYTRRWGVLSEAPITVSPASAVDCAGLQIADYFLWSLQRFYERQEDRFLELLWPDVVFVWDRDDTRASKSGVFYQGRPKSRGGRRRSRGGRPKPLTKSALEGRPGI